MLAKVLHFESFFRVNLQNVLNQLFTLLRDVGLFRKGKLALTNELNDMRGMRPVKRQTAKDHIIKYDTTRPYVNRRGIAFFLCRQDFRRHVLKRAGIKIRVELISNSTDPKICNLDKHILPGLEKNVFDFEIAMNNILSMTV